MSKRCAVQTAHAKPQGYLLQLALSAALAGCAPAASSEPSGKATSADEKDAAPRSADAGRKPVNSTDDEPVDEPAPSDAGATSQSSSADAGSKGGSTGWCEAKAVLEKHCTACHDGEGTGGSPMSLKLPSDFTVAAKVSKGKTVAEAVSARTHDTSKPMPPKGVMPAADLAVLDAWIAAGTPGDDSSCAGGGDAGVPVSADGRVDGWNPDECDEIYQIRSHGTGTAPYTVPPGTEVHPQISIDAPWGNETVQAIGFKPFTDNKKVLHHWILNNAQRAFLAGWAPGDDARPPFPKDVGMEMPKGARAFTLDMHYNSLNETSSNTDTSGVDICVLKGEHLRPKLAAVTGSFATIGNFGVLAPAGAMNAPVTGTCNVSAAQPVHLLTAAPHAHTYARHMKFTVTKKDGTEIVMHDADFSFGEQGTYPLPGGEVVLEKGDVVKTTCYYTNPTTRNITFSESTTGEMCFNFALYYPKGALGCR